MQTKSYYDQNPCGSGGDYFIESLLKHPAVKRWARRQTTKSEARFFDAGCGSGKVGWQVSSGLQALGGVRWTEVVGMDFIEEKDSFFDRCSPPMMFIQKGLDGENLPLPDGQFDFILCNHVFEHIFNTEKLSRELFRVLKPGGICVLNVPNASWWMNRLFLLMGMSLSSVEAGSESIGHGFPALLKRRWAHCSTAGHIRCITAWGLKDLAIYGGFQFEGWWRQNHIAWRLHCNPLSRFIGVIVSKPSA